MPKKHTPGYEATKPQPTSHVSLTSRSRALSENSDRRPTTVNGRLAQLRINQKSIAKTPSSPDLALPSVLSEPSRAQRTLIQNIRRSGRIAGPPPPRSWANPRTIAQGLESSRWAPKRSQNEVDFEAITWHPPPTLPDQPLPEASSLRATTMRVLARTLSRQIEGNQWLTYDLTPRLKCELLAIMAMSPPRSSGKLSQGKLEYLFGPLQQHDGSWISGGEGVTHLSLGSVIGVEVDYSYLAKNLRRNSPIAREDIPESWDDIDDTSIATGQCLEEESQKVRCTSENYYDGDPMAVLSPTSLWLPLLPSLTHLSLAQPVSPCWSSLLDVGGLDCLAHLTHLDLSYWPAPSLRFLTHEDRITPLQTELARSLARENNEKEELRVLNRLGKACRKLTWLGLEGCESWLQCLTAVHQTANLRPRSRFDMDEKSSNDNLIRMDWIGVWRGLKSIKVIQAWVPLPFLSPETLAKDPFVQTTASPDSSFIEWWEQEKRVRKMENLVAEWRLEAGLPPIRFEKTPVQPWIEVEIRDLDSRQAAMHWRNNPNVSGIGSIG